MTAEDDLRTRNNELLKELSDDLKALRVTEIPELKVRLASIEGSLAAIPNLKTDIDSNDERLKKLEGTRHFIGGVWATIGVVVATAANYLVFWKGH